MNKPHDSLVGRTGIYDRSRSYQSIVWKAEKHAKKICGIAISRPDEAARIHMIQPLFVAGQILQGKPERDLVLYFLREIEAELGWSTHDCVEQLSDMWT